MGALFVACLFTFPTPLFMVQPTAAHMLLIAALAVGSLQPNAAFAQQVGTPGSMLTRGMQLVYASQGAESAPWVVDSLSLSERFGTAKAAMCASVNVMFGEPVSSAIRSSPGATAPNDLLPLGPCGPE